MFSACSADDRSDSEFPNFFQILSKLKSSLLYLYLTWKKCIQMRINNPITVLAVCETAPRGGFKAPPLIFFAETGACIIPPLFLQNQDAWLCWRPGKAAFLFKKVLAPPLKIPGSTPGPCNFEKVPANCTKIYVMHAFQMAQNMSGI